jgi:putative acetyltransferase
MQLTSSPAVSISVRRALVGDAAAYARIMGDPAVYPGLMQMPFASEELWRQRLTDANALGKTDLLLVAELNGDVVGSAGLHPVGPNIRRRHAWMLGISVLPQVRRQGVGTALMQAMCDYADNWIGALRLELGVYTDNVGAMALYRKFNFEIEGTQRGYALRDGVYVDSHMMVRFHPNPPRPPSR